MRPHLFFFFPQTEFLSLGLPNHVPCHVELMLYTTWLIWVDLTEIIWTAEPTISYVEFCRIAISFSKGSGPYVLSCCLHSWREEPMAHFSFVGRRVMLLCFTKASLVVFLRLTWELSWSSGILCGGVPSVAVFSDISGLLYFWNSILMFRLCWVALSLTFHMCCILTLGYEGQGTHCWSISQWGW